MFMQQIISNAKYRGHTEPNGGGGELNRNEQERLEYQKYILTFARYFGSQYKPISVAEQKNARNIKGSSQTKV